MGTLSVDKLVKTSSGAAEFTLPENDGTAGQAMTTDGAGQLSFSAVDALPSQTGNADKFLQTDGSAATWEPAAAAADSIVNSQINTAAAIAQSKLANVAKWTSSATAPTSPAPVDGDQWYDSNNEQLKIYQATASSWSACNPSAYTATGGTVTSYSSGGNTYTVHTFTSSGNFVVSQGEKALDILVVAGGASGGGRHGGGGGRDG